MNKVVINIKALQHNLGVVQGWIKNHGGSLTVVTKALCGNKEIVGALGSLGVTSVGDSRILNLAALKRLRPAPQTWYLRPAHMSAIPEIVELADISLNSESVALKALDRECERRGRRHKVVIMIELGDLREGVLPGALLDFYRDAFALKHLRIVGLGANLGCLSGTVPGVDQLTQLSLYHELIELKFGQSLPYLSAGTSASLPLLLEGRFPKRVNHFRVGESILLGSDLINGGTLPGLRSDVATLEAEVVEIKEKSLVASGESGHLSPFGVNEPEMPTAPGQRGYRALVTVGHVDTDVAGLEPENPMYQIAGASSDLTVLNLGSEPGSLRIGDQVRFRLSYAAFVRLMGNPYTIKTVSGEVASRRMPAIRSRGRMLPSLSCLSEEPAMAGRA